LDSQLIKEAKKFVAGTRRAKGGIWVRQMHLKQAIEDLKKKEIETNIEAHESTLLAG
jgi:hypothetical protein